MSGLGKGGAEGGGGCSRVGRAGGDQGQPLGRAHRALVLGVVGSLGGCCAEEGGHGLMCILRLTHLQGWRTD